MGAVREAETALYESAWEIDNYSKKAAGDLTAGFYPELLDPPGSLLDAGCGTAKTGLKLSQAGHTVTLCDLTPDGIVPEARDLHFVKACIWEDLLPVAYLGSVHRRDEQRESFDWVICTDVLEHLPAPLTMLAVWQLRKIAKKGLFLTIALHADELGVLVGEPLHKTVLPYIDWLKLLREVGPVVDARDLQSRGMYLLAGGARG